ncbi:MAG: hypothetical protein V1876_00720 [Candidatus Peregrinibacteria bacterium]
MSTILETSSNSIEPADEVPTPSTVFWHISKTQLGAQEESAILLRARFQAGDTVKHPRYGQGTVRRVWAEGDGTIWVSVQRDGRRGDQDFDSFSVREDCFHLAQA